MSNKMDCKTIDKKDEDDIYYIFGNIDLLEETEEDEYLEYERDYEEDEYNEFDKEYSSADMFKLPPSEYYDYNEETARMDYEIPPYSFEEEDEDGEDEYNEYNFNEYDVVVQCDIFNDYIVLERKDILYVKMPILDEYEMNETVPVVIKYICPMCEEIKEDKKYIQRRYLQDSRNPIRQYFIS